MQTGTANACLQLIRRLGAAFKGANASQPTQSGQVNATRLLTSLPCGMLSREPITCTQSGYLQPLQAAFSYFPPFNGDELL